MMKAATFAEYGPPSVVSVNKVARPEITQNDLLVRVHNATVNRTDAGFRSAQYFISRFFSGLFKPKFPILGCEFSGVVEAVGPGVTTFRAGDRVFGYNDETFGGHAEYLTIPADKAVAHVPAHVSMDQAAALTEGSHYALSAIRASGIQPGQRVMVYGATGAIGSAAVQLLAHENMEVLAVCGTAHRETVKALGASEVFDYQQQDIRSIPHAFDFFFDAVGKQSYFAVQHLLKPGGVYISTELGPWWSNIWLSLWSPLFMRKKVRFPLPTMDADTMNYLKARAEDGSFKPLIDRSYALEDIVEAYTYVESGQKVGNVLLSVSSSAQSHPESPSPKNTFA